MIMIFQWVFCEEAKATLAKEIRAAFFALWSKEYKILKEFKNKLKVHKNNKEVYSNGSNGSHLGQSMNVSSS